MWMKMGIFISPGSFSIFFSIQLVTMVLIGGLGSLWGAVLGAILLTVLPEALHVVKEYNVLVYGLILMAVLIFYPQGLLPGIQEAFRKRKGEAGEDPGKDPELKKGVST